MCSHRTLLAVTLITLVACGDDDSAADSGAALDASDATAMDSARDAARDARADEDVGAMDDARVADAMLADATSDDAASDDAPRIDAGSARGDCDEPIDLAAVGTPITNGYSFAIDFAGRRDVVTPSCQDSGLVDVVLRFVPTRDGPIHARTSRGSAALAAYETCGDRELDCQYDGAYSVVGLLDFDGRAGVAVDLVVSARSTFATVILDVREMPVGGEGELCDVMAIESLCGPGLACAATGADARCSATRDVGCGAGRTVIDLTTAWETMGHLSYAGSFRGALDVGAVSCGRGAAEQDVAHVVHLMHAARISSVGAINIAAAVSVRTGCRDGEIGCSLTTRVPDDHVFPAGSDVYFVAQRADAHVGDEYVLDVVRETLLEDGEPCTAATGALPRSVCRDGLACDETTGRCRPTVCPDGRAEGLEACDDGNALVDDGCSPTCELEDQGDGGDGCPGTALRLVPGPAGTYVAYATGTTAGHDDDTNGADCPGVFMSEDVRYEISVPEAGRLTLSFDTPGGWDPAVRIHAGACGGARVSAPVLACQSSATLPEPWSISTDVGGGAHSITIDQGLGRGGGPYSLLVTLTPR